ncbi:MAG: hypothetical protein HY369_01580 [Candidatus Aenigmarchaeota archaeon]|nr:hypothetical protein [Candidatus Aenigmarchaeota archaeon]
MLRDIASRLPQGDDDTDEPVADTPAPDPRPGTSGKATTSPSRPAAATGPETSSKATTRASPPAPRRGDGDPAVLAALLAQVLEAQAKHAAHGRQPADTPPAKSPGSTTREPGTSAGRPDDGDAATGGQPRAGGPR